MEKEKTIYVFADFLNFHNELIGKIFVSQTREKSSMLLSMNRVGLKTDVRY